MDSYNFSTLNDKDFEQLSKDLLNAKFDLNLQSFKIGVDKGIDLRYSTSENNNAIVVQAKHYVNSKYSNLKHILKHEELDKVINLNPDRYILVTSLSLSAVEKDELKNIMSPFILTSNDVIAQSDLNDIIAEHKELETKHFKLWFSSTNIINIVLNNAIEGRTKNLLLNISKKISFYVITKKLDDAIVILQKEKILLITGQPGIGKTTLAEIILFERAKNNYKVYKIEDIREAEDVISVNDDEKQLFYFDDFLGANYVEIVSVNKTESQLTSFVERVKNTPNKYLILTTRTVILNHAVKNYEKINRSKLSNQQFEIKLTDYTRYEKALILYNHLFFRGIENIFYNSILDNKFYLTIIGHKNYTPRIIEFVTDKQRVSSFTVIQFHQFILNNLNNPEEIWRYSFTNQIAVLDRCLILTLFTLGNFVFENDFIPAYENRLQFEIKNHNQIVEPNQFKLSLHILLNGFIVSNLINIEFKTRYYTFINPSLVDFLIGYVSESYQEKKSIISSIIYVEQLNRFNPDEGLIPLEKDLQKIIREKIVKFEIKIRRNYTNVISPTNKESAIMLETLCKFCKEINIDNILLINLKRIDFKIKKNDFFKEIKYFLINLNDAPQTIEFIKDNFFEIISSLMVEISDSNDAKILQYIFKKFDFDYGDYSNSDDGLETLLNVATNILKRNEEKFYDEKKKKIENIDEVTEYYEEILDLEKQLKIDLFPNVSIDYDFGIKLDEDYWKNQIQENNERFDEEAKNYNESSDYYEHVISEKENEDQAIDDLFSKA